MEFVFKIDSNLKFDIKKLPEKEYIEKEITPCVAFFSADVIFADLVSAVFKNEGEENDNGD